MGVSGLLGALSASAWAQSPDEALRAEQGRLQSEIQRLAERETWDGVERLYLQLQSLEEQGLPMTYAEHILGAQSAQSRGDVTVLRTRLQRAIDEWDTPFAVNWFETLETRYGQLSVTVSPRFKELLVLRAVEPPFEADARAAIEFAQTSLDEEQAFEGWLPSGEYTLGARRFTVSVKTPATVRFEPDSGSASSGGAALRARLSGGFGAAGAPNAAEIQPAAFGGFSPQVGIGGQLPVGGPVSLGAEIGWLGTFAGESIGTINLGYGWVFAAAEVGSISVEAGPMFGVGQGRGVGVDPESRQAYCETNACPQGVPESDLELTGGIRGAGLGLGGAMPIGQTGPIQWSAGAHLGALNDSSRWYPWLLLGVTARLGGGA